MLSQTSTTWAPGYVVTPTTKWFGHLATAAVLVMALRAINPGHPAADPSVRDDDRLPKGHRTAPNHPGRGAGTGAAPSLTPPYELDRDGPPTAERVPAPEPAGSSGPHQPSEGVQGGSGAGAVPKVRRTMTKATATMAAASPETYALASTGPT